MKFNFEYPIWMVRNCIFIFMWVYLYVCELYIMNMNYAYSYLCAFISSIIFYVLCYYLIFIFFIFCWLKQIFLSLNLHILFSLSCFFFSAFTGPHTHLFISPNLFVNILFISFAYLYLQIDENICLSTCLSFIIFPLNENKLFAFFTIYFSSACHSYPQTSLIGYHLFIIALINIKIS